MQGIKALFQKLQGLVLNVTSVLLTVMIGVVFLQTFCRFVIFRSLSWSEELSRYLFVAVIVLGINVAMRKKMMVRIEIIDGYLKGKGAAAMNLVRRFVALFVNIIYVYSACELIKIGSLQTSPAMGIPMSLLYSIILAGFVLNVLAALLDLFEACEKPQDGKEAA